MASNPHSAHGLLAVVIAMAAFCASPSCALRVSAGPQRGGGWIPQGLYGYWSSISPSGDYRDGCIRSATDDLYITWEIHPYVRTPGEVVSAESIQDRTTSGFLWTKVETLHGFELKYGLARRGPSDTVIVNTRGLWLIAGVKSQMDVDRVVDIARARTAGQDCPTCQPLQTVPPYRDYAVYMHDGCSLPVSAPPATDPTPGPGAADPSRAVIDRLREVFPVADRAKQWFRIGGSWLLQPSCAGNTVSRMTVGRDLGKGGTSTELGASEFRELVTQINRVRSVGADGFDFVYGPLAGVRTGWPIHAQFGHAMLEGSVFGGDPLSVRPFTIWYYRRISGTIEALRGPISSDRRAVVKIGGEWYWTSEAGFATLNVGQTVQDLVAAGPDGPPVLSDVPTCSPSWLRSR